jgi:NHLM bacteriocin system ABC transporter ATP-binding protein
MLSETTALPSPDASETRRAFSLGEERLMWVVQSGELEVFAVRTPEGNESGALRPLLRLTPGQAAFSVRADDAAGVRLIARRSPGAAIAARAAVDDGGLTRRGETRDDLALVEQWVASLSRSAAGELPPKDAGVIVPDTSVSTDEEPKTLAAAAGSLVWLRQVAGTSHFLGRPEVVIAAGTVPLPLARPAWIEAQPASELSVTAGPSSLRDGEFWEGLNAFHRNALTCIVRALDEADATERQRLQDRSRADARAVEAALRDLASPLTGDGDRVDAGVPHSDTPLMRACHAIGRLLGVTMKPHPDMLRGRPIKNPVSSIAHASGIRYRRVALKDDWWKQGSEPLLVFRNEDNHPFALLPRRARRGYLVYDPDVPGLTRLNAETAATLNPFGVMFYRPFPQVVLTPRPLLAFGLKDSGRELLMIAGMGIASGLLSMLLPFVTGEVFDSLIPGARRPELVTACGVLVVAAFATALFNLARGLTVLRLQGKLSARLQAGLWDRLLSLPVPFFKDYAAGDLADRSMAFSQIRTVLTGATLAAILSGVASIFNFGLLFYYSAKLALLATLLTGIAMVITLTAGVIELRLQRVVSAHIGRIAGVVVEFITGIAKFRVAGAEHRAFVLWVTDFAHQKRSDFEARTVSSLLVVFNAVYLAICLAVLFFANSGIDSWRDSALTTGQFLAFVAAFSQFMTAALLMSGSVVSVLNVVPLYERASPILHALPEVTTAQSTPAELTGEIDANHLMFRYRPDAPLVLKDVSFHIPSGQYVAFVGPSGCGKSTLFRVLLGFERLGSGSVYYDGKDLSGLDVQAVRRQIGVVLQSGTLVSGSIKDNICGAAWVAVDDVWEAVRLAGLEEDVKNMPMGLHTMVQAGGGGLSGGQRQRILIARAIVGKPRVLLFDEATSALDNRTQAIVSDSLKALKATRIVIAHRLSTILEADRIFVMDQGRIVQSGSYGELIQQEGLFRELASRQLM